MALFRRSTNQSTHPLVAGPSLRLLGTGHNIDAVGLTHRIEACERAFAAVHRSPDAWMADRWVTLRREPDNRYDPNAVSVDLSGELVGYLSADDARIYAPILDACGHQWTAFTAPARIKYQPADSAQRHEFDRDAFFHVHIHLAKDQTIVPVNAPAVDAVADPWFPLPRCRFEMVSTEKGSTWAAALLADTGGPFGAWAVFDFIGDVAHAVIPDVGIVATQQGDGRYRQTSEAKAWFDADRSPRSTCMVPIFAGATKTGTKLVAQLDEQTPDWLDGKVI